MLTITEAAARLDVSRTRVRQFIADGRLPAHRYGQRVVLIDEAALAPLQQPRTVGYPKGRPRKPSHHDGAAL